MNIKQSLITGAAAALIALSGCSSEKGANYNNNPVPYKTIAKSSVEQLYYMTPAQLCHAINDMNQRYELGLPKLSDRVETASLIRIIYFEEEFYKYQQGIEPEQLADAMDYINKKYRLGMSASMIPQLAEFIYSREELQGYLPGENDEYFYESFRAIANVMMNRIALAQNKLPITNRFMSRPDMLGDDFNSLYHEGTPKKPGALKTGEWNCLDAREDFFTVDGTNIYVPKFEAFATTAYSDVDGQEIAMNKSLTRVAVKAFVDTVLGVQKVSPTKVRIGVRDDNTEHALFYKNQDASIQWWSGNKPFGPDYVWYCTKKINAHEFFSVGLTKEAYNLLEEHEQSKLEKIKIPSFKEYSEDPDGEFLGYIHIWVPKEDIK